MELSKQNGSHYLCRFEFKHSIRMSWQNVGLCKVWDISTTEQAQNCLNNVTSYDNNRIEVTHPQHHSPQVSYLWHESLKLVNKSPQNDSNVDLEPLVLVFLFYPLYCCWAYISQPFNIGETDFQLPTRQ